MEDICYLFRGNLEQIKSCKSIITRLYNIESKTKIPKLSRLFIEDILIIKKCHQKIA